MQVISSGITDVGLKREGNEDSYTIEDTLGLYIVADGMGGHQAGEVASRIAVEIVNRCFKKWSDKEAYPDELFGSQDVSLTVKGNYLLSSIRLANRIIFELSATYEQYQGMGTTIVLLLVTPKLLIAANVGDSRIYMVRDGRIERLSKDHTVVSEQIDMGIMTEEEAATSPLKHVLTKNLGSAEIMDADIYEIEPTGSDRFVLCSDGLTDLVSDQEILTVVQNDDDPEHLCRSLLEISLKRGAPDNTTVISIFLEDAEKNSWKFLNKFGFFLTDSVTAFKKIFRR